MKLEHHSPGLGAGALGAQNLISTYSMGAAVFRVNARFSFLHSVAPLPYRSLASASN